MKIGILQGGGTCPGANDTHRGFIETAWKHGHQVVVIPYGYEGLLTEQDFKDVTTLEPVRSQGLAGLYRERGCFIGTSRTKPLPIEDDGRILEENLQLFEENRDKIRANLERNEIDMLAVSGGDDTLGRGLRNLHIHGILDLPGSRKKHVRTTGTPKTIDNDFEGMELSYGAMSAAARGRRLLDELFQAETCNNKKPMVLEAMGRGCGWLAAMIAQGDPRALLLIPEYEIPKEDFVRTAKPLIEEARRKLVIVVSESYRIDGKKTYQSGDPDSYGHNRPGGVRMKIAEWLEKAGISTQQQCPQYLFRSCRPTRKDADFAYQLGVTAMEAALEGTGDGKVSFLPPGRKRGDRVELMDMADVRGGKTLSAKNYNPSQLRFTGRVE
ncbi:hypothetical protein COU79_02135 [Candidatus Peregrinibacteria bacterium CG10_big_fil_rev_8_21_14_0_10_54_7]|nr:MAG: hypothetical protein COU79_02135 [Candidatus Peregrinibacteria bacterium CG10_big_fil_rev_8_21_14_0_10_54_7]